jgi:uridine kinase
MWTVNETCFRLTLRKSINFKYPIRIVKKMFRRINRKIKKRNREIKDIFWRKYKKRIKWKVTSFIKSTKFKFINKER